MAQIDVTSAAFRAGERIPADYACTGKNESPPLSWQGVPYGTRSITIICEDPDCSTGTFIHWILYNIPPGMKGLDRGVPKKPVLPDGSAHGLNDFGKMEYGGPCPPPGKPHRYVFRVFALDAPLALRSPVTRKGITAAMTGHILGQGELVGIFSR